ncbi:hypothetical protein GQ54DRAFT_225900 [Martensiomyces pterosporus]|nr:hypothetical protein GQ54DRAFT_225900 [Martensiomyces pterosporus]
MPPRQRSASSAVASGASASGPGAAGTLARERSKAGAGAGAAAAAASSSSSTAAAQAQHHPVLQQLSRERKQQLRHQQARTQQKAVEAAGEEEANGTAQQTRQRQAESALVASVDSQSTAANRTSAESTPSKKKTKYREVEEKQQQAAQPATQTTKAPTGEESMEAGGSNDQPATSTKDFEEGKRLVLSTESRIPAPVPATPGAIPSPIITQQNTAEAASAAEPAALNHTSSAQSFQSIAESLVAQLNAKVSTPTSSTIPAFPSASGFDSRVGGRVAGFPVSGVDPLLFPPSAGGPPSSLFGRTNSGLGAPVSSFDPFANPAASPWGGASTANSNPYGHSPLSALLTDAGALSPSLGGGRDAPTSAGLPSYSSRQRSRWDFALADEASAQAELQSVLGRGFGSTDEHISELQQPQNAPSFASSRDLGLFSTPAPVGNGSAPTWGRHQPDNAAGQQQPESGSTTPFPPPGFGKAGTDSLVRLASSTPPTSLAGGSASIGAGPNTLLSRLIGQTGTSLGTAAPGLLMSAMPPPGIGTDISANTPMPPPGYYQQQHAPQGQFQDPAILSSYMAATAVTSATGSGAAGGQHMLNPGLGGSATANQQQHQQHQQSRTDPIVLNSLLARLHLGGRDSDNSPSFINSNSSNPLGAAGQQPSSSIMPPGLMQTAGAASSPLYAGQLGNVLTSGLGHQNMAGGGSMVPQMAPSQGQHSGGFVDPAIMHIGRLNAASAMGVAPTAPVGPPPGIMSPPTMEDVHGQQHPQQTLMPSRSANSSGRSRFLNHFSADPAAVAANIEQQRAVNQGGSGAGGNNNEGDDDNDKGMPMVNGVPPGLPTTGLFGELLRRAKQDSMASSGSVAGGDAAAAGLGGGNYVSGRMMVGDIERKIGEARKEARELQAQLGSAIERNQPTLWALRNGGSLDGAAASSSGIKHISM